MRNNNSPYKKHKVKITFTSSMVVEVETTTSDKALDIAIQEFSDLSAEDFVGRSCDINFTNIE